MSSPPTFDACAIKARAIQDFHDFVSSGKVRFWRQYGMDIVMGRRQGPYFWDLDGSRCLFNLHGNGGVFNLGHRHPQVVAALQEALAGEDIGNGHLISKARADLGRRLAALMPGDLDYTVFGASGGEAVDLAFKIARAYTGKTRIISARGAYHGHTGLAMAAGDEKYRAPFGPPAPGFVQVPFNDVGALEAALDDDTAAVVLETVPATLGMPIPAPEYLPAVRRCCDRRGALLILDEVQTGLGRTGRLWGFSHFDVLPDIVVLAKGLSGGIYPITATVLRRPIERVFHPDPHIHVSTFGGAELGCRVALKVLDICSAPSFLAHVNRLAERFAEGVARIAARHRILKGLRQLGLFMGLAFEDERCGPLMSAAAFHHGLFMVYANNDRSVSQLLPPLVTTLEEADWVLERLDRAVADVQKLHGGF
jgi:acetylornithine/succinyldiaminopimelate/putrescine aminotransferase